MWAEIIRFVNFVYKCLVGWTATMGFVIVFWCALLNFAVNIQITLQSQLQSKLILFRSLAVGCLFAYLCNISCQSTTSIVIVIQFQYIFRYYLCKNKSFKCRTIVLVDLIEGRGKVNFRWKFSSYQTLLVHIPSDQITAQLWHSLKKLLSSLNIAMYEMIIITFFLSSLCTLSGFLLLTYLLFHPHYKIIESAHAHVSTVSKWQT